MTAGQWNFSKTTGIAIGASLARLRSRSLQRLVFVLCRWRRWPKFAASAWALRDAHPSPPLTRSQLLRKANALRPADRGSGAGARWRPAAAKGCETKAAEAASIIAQVEGSGTAVVVEPPSGKSGYELSSSGPGTAPCVEARDDVPGSREVVDEILEAHRNNREIAVESIKSITSPTLKPGLIWLATGAVPH